jgi:hypothetical protein
VLKYSSNNASHIYFICCLLFLAGCSDSESGKVANLETRLQESIELYDRVWKERNMLRQQVNRISSDLGSASNKLSNYEGDTDRTRKLITLLAAAKYEEATIVAKSIDQGIFDEFDEQVLFHN